MAENRQPVGDLVHRTPNETNGPLINPALVGCAGSSRASRCPEWANEGAVVRHTLSIELHDLRTSPNHRSDNDDAGRTVSEYPTKGPA